MIIGIIGMGYVGQTFLSFMLVNNTNNKYICIDNDRVKVDNMSSGFLCKEKNISELIKKHKRIVQFSTDLDQYLPDIDMIHICVGTPSSPNGSLDIRNVLAICKRIEELGKDNIIVVIHSTMDIGSCRELKTKYLLDKILIYIPEFIREGTALHDMLNPDRVIFGTYDKYIPDVISEIYKNIDSPKIIVNYEEAEVIKLASNNYLAMRISFINSISRLVREYKADIEVVSQGIGLDKRIGLDYFTPGIGYGGYCLPKDNLALIQTIKSANQNAGLLEQVKEINDSLPRIYAEEINSYYEINCIDKTIAFIKCVYKENTIDIRNSQTLKLGDYLLKYGFLVYVWDTHVYDELLYLYKNVNSVQLCRNISEIINKVKGIVCTVNTKDILREINPYINKLKNKVLFSSVQLDENLRNAVKHFYIL